MSRSRLPVRWKVAASTVLCSHAAGRLCGFVFRHRIPHYGLRFDTSHPAFTPRIEAQLLWGVYEGAESRFIRAHLAGSETVVELGASIGVTGSHALGVMRDGGLLVAVEANPALLAVLESTLRAHAGSRRVRVVHAAVDGGPGSRAAFRVTEDSVGSHLVRLGRTPGARDSVGAGDAVWVPAVSLAGLVEEQRVTRFSLVSDIEGAEHAFIIGDDTGLDGCDRMVIELHATPQASVDDLVAALTDRHGFTVVAREGPVLALRR